MPTLSPMQSSVLDEIIAWYEKQPKAWVHCNGASDCPPFPHTHGNGTLAPIRSLGGWAGSGKTTLMRVLDESIQGETLFCAPTHKAAGVLSRKLGGGQAERVRTYHSMVYSMVGIYRCTVTRAFVFPVKVSCKCGKPDACECPMKFLPCAKGTPHACHVTQELKAERRVHLGGHRDLIVIDESSMLDSQHIEDVRRFGVPVLVVGDHGQLPPIKAVMNRYTLKPDWELTEIHRQGADSGVLTAAHDVRRYGALRQNAYGGGPKPDTVVMRGTDPRVKELLDRFTPSPDRAVIVYTNALRAEFNRAYHGEGPVRVGDRVVCLAHQPYEVARVRLENGVPRATGEFLKVHNAMTGTVLKASERGLCTDMTVQLDDHPLAKPRDPVVVLSGSCPTAQFGAPRELPFNSEYRPKGSHVWDYAYALTAHKAQGSEFEQVIVVDQHPAEYARWMYTAITRGKKAVVVIDWGR